MFQVVEAGRLNLSIFRHEGAELLNLRMETKKWMTKIDGTLRVRARDRAESPSLMFDEECFMCWNSRYFLRIPRLNGIASKFAISNGHHQSSPTTFSRVEQCVGCARKMQPSSNGFVNPSRNPGLP